jgi:hypothetical protein
MMTFAMPQFYLKIFSIQHISLDFDVALLGPLNGNLNKINLLQLGRKKL